MSRLLLSLSLVATLAACQTDGSDAGPGTPPDTAAPPGTVVAAGWDLPWYYLAAPVCLVGGVNAMSAPPDTLVRQLKALPDDEFKRVLLGDNPSIPLIERVRGIVNGGDPRYPWIQPWPDSLKVYVMRRAESPASALAKETVLGPNRLVLPWPFPNDTGRSLEQRADDLDVEIPQAPAVSPGAGTFHLGGLLSEADSLVIPLISSSDPLRLVKDNPAQVKNAIITRLRMHPDYSSSSAPFPGSPLLISVHCPSRNDCWPTDTTRVRYVPGAKTPGRIHLELGWNPDRTPKPYEILFSKWPCDALLSR